MVGVFPLLAAGKVSHQDKRDFMEGHVVIIQQASLVMMCVSSTAFSISLLISGA